MSKRKGPKQSNQGTRDQATSEPSLLASIVAVLSGAFLVARLVIPTEAALQGTTLWLTQLWLLTGLIWIWDRYRQSDYQLSCDWFDVGMLMLVLGHALSAIKVFVMMEQRRAALNLTWEWIGLGVSCLLIRSQLRNTVSPRSLFLIYIMVATVLAGMGFWQHYVFYPQMAQQYRLLRNRLDENPADLAAQQQLLEMGVPPDALEPPARLMWEQRLEGSTEPFGGFALANSFAALLLVGTMLAGLSMIRYTRSKTDKTVLFVKIISLLMVAYCLVLTKSRTAWLGLIAGLIVWSVLSGVKKLQMQNADSTEPLSSKNPRQQSWLTAGISSGVIILLIVMVAVIATFSGSLDHQVLAEAPKSVLYRLQYWHGTWEVIQQNPILGAGPGNFRQHYLQYKLPESSEEISDPHNFVLDLWVNGGLLSLCGMSLLVLLSIKQVWSDMSHTEQTENESASKPDQNSARLNAFLVNGSCCGFVLVLLYEIVTGAALPLRILQLLIMGLCGFSVLQVLRQEQATRPNWQQITAFSVMAGLFVHLTGAGGMEMPAIAQLLLVYLTICCTVTPCDDSRRDTGATILQTESSTLFAIIAILILLLNICCLLTGLRPVFSGHSLIQRGDADYAAGNVTQAERAYQAASSADTLNPEPLMKLAQLHWLSTERELKAGRYAQSEFESAKTLAQRAIALDPRSANGYRMLGNWYYQVSLALQNRGDESSQTMAKEAVNWFDRAIDRYPNYALLQAEAALAAELANQRNLSQERALRSLELDEINHQAKHLDKYLTPEWVGEMKRIAGTSNSD